MKTITIIILGAVLAVASWALPQGTVIQQLEAKYVPTVMDASGIKVATPGTILVVQIDGVMVASKGKMSGLYYNEFKNGVIGSDTNLMHVGLNHRAFNPHALAVGDKVYLTKLETSATSITFQVQSCGTCDPKAIDPSHRPAQAEVTFKFIKGGLQSTDFKQVKQYIEKVFMLPEDVPPATDNTANAGGAPGTQPAAGTPQQGTAQPPPANDPPPPPVAPQPAQPDDPPPPPPPADAVKITLGMSIDQVHTLMGDPVTVFDKGTSVNSKGVKVSTVVYVYKGNLKLTFSNGKLSSYE